MIERNQLVYRKRSKDSLTVMEEDLRLCTVKPAAEIDRRFCFEVVSPSRCVWCVCVCVLVVVIGGYQNLCVCVCVCMCVLEVVFSGHQNAMGIQCARVCLCVRESG